MSWLQRSLFRRMLVCCSVPALCGLVILGYIVVGTYESAARSAAEQELIRQGKSINVALNQSDAETYDSLLASMEQTLQKRITVYDLSGNIAAVSYADEVYTNKPLHPDALNNLHAGGVIRNGIVRNEEDQEVLSVIVPWGSEENLRGGLEIQMSADSLLNASQHIREQFVWSAILMFILAAFASSLLYWSISRPLKLIETTATAHLAWSTVDVRHGPVALAAPGRPVVVHHARGPVTEDAAEDVATLRERGVDVWVVGDELPGGRATIGVPGDLPEHLRPLVHAVRLQQLALATARARGVDPDQPPGLSKVTPTT